MKLKFTGAGRFVTHGQTNEVSCGFLNFHF